MLNTINTTLGLDLTEEFFNNDENYCLVWYMFKGIEINRGKVLGYMKGVVDFDIKELHQVINNNVSNVELDWNDLVALVKDEVLTQL